jgi:hypothetical protein
MSTSRQIATAYHEASHAVAALSLGLRLRKRGISIERDEDSLGQCYTRKPFRGDPDALTFSLWTSLSQSATPPNRPHVLEVDWVQCTECSRLVCSMDDEVAQVRQSREVRCIRYHLSVNP